MASNRGVKIAMSVNKIQARVYVHFEDLVPVFSKSILKLNKCRLINRRLLISIEW